MGVLQTIGITDATGKVDQKVAKGMAIGAVTVVVCMLLFRENTITLLERKA